MTAQVSLRTNRQGQQRLIRTLFGCTADDIATSIAGGIVKISNHDASTVGGLSDAT